jgi:tetratricopeptide (TPR) repeat protein
VKDTNTIQKHLSHWFLVLSLALACFCGHAYAWEGKEAAWEQAATTAMAAGDLSSARKLAEPRLGDPASAAAAHRLLGAISFRQQLHTQAIQHFEEAGEAGVRDETMLEEWAESLRVLRRPAEACQLLEDALQRDPALNGLRPRLADLYTATGQPQKALPHLEHAYREGIRNARVTLELASARFAVGQDYLALELLDPLVQSAPSPNLLLQAGKLYFRNLLYQQAVVPLERSWKLAGPSYESGMYLSLTYYQLGRHSDCAQILSQIRPDAAEASEYHILNGSALARLAKWDEARTELERAVALAENRADGYLNLGLYWIERGDRHKAWKLLEKGSKLMVPGTKILYTLGTRTNCDGARPPSTGGTTNRDKALFYANLAESFHKMHHWVSALEIFLLALDEDPELQAPYGKIGLICQELGSPEAGREFLERGIELHPEAADLHFYLGTVHYALGQHDEAVASYQKALKLDGPTAPARHWLFLGIAQAGGGRESQEQARLSLLRACEIDPRLALAHYELGKWYLKNEQPGLAESLLERAIELDPQLLGAYYQCGLASLRNGKVEKGRALMNTFQKKRALRAPSARPHSEKDLPAPEEIGQKLILRSEG